MEIPDFVKVAGSGSPTQWAPITISGWRVEARLICRPQKGNLDLGHC